MLRPLAPSFLIESSSFLQVTRTTKFEFVHDWCRTTRPRDNSDQTTRTNEISDQDNSVQSMRQLGPIQWTTRPILKFDIKGPASTLVYIADLFNIVYKVIVNGDHLAKEVLSGTPLLRPMQYDRTFFDSVQYERTFLDSVQYGKLLTFFTLEQFSGYIIKHII